MADPFIGQIVLFAGPYIPDGWALCAGQTLSISQNPNLFAVLGTTYGGNGVDTFMLPNLINRFPMGTGFDTDSKVNTPSGQTGGNNSVTLTLANLPPHTHTLNVSSAPGSADTTSPKGSLANSNEGTGNTPVPIYGASTDSTANPGAIGSTGGGSNGTAPLDLRPQYIAMNYIIAVSGSFLGEAPTAAPGQVNTTANIQQLGGVGPYPLPHP